MTKKNGPTPTTAPNPEPTHGADARASLLYQLLETEMGGVQVYRTAVECAINPELRTEWTQYLAETERHVVVARELLHKLGLDPDAEIPARVLCRHKAEGLVRAMLEALASGNAAAAQLTAAECVVDAETKDHMNWSLLGTLAKKSGGEAAEAMRAAHAEVEPEEDRHLYHTAGWVRELWIEALGLPAVLPPPEEQKHVESAIAAAKAKAGRETMA